MVSEEKGVCVAVNFGLSACGPDQQAKPEITNLNLAFGGFIIILSTRAVFAAGS